MWIKRSTLRKTAVWLAGTFVTAAIAEPLIFQTLQDHGVLKKPENWVWAMIAFSSQIIETRWFDIVAAFLGGSAASLWLDMILRRQETPDRNVDVPRLIQVSDLEPTLGSAELVLQFHGGPNTPTELRSENVLQWYALWSADFHSFFEGADGQRQHAISIPRTWAIFIVLNKPIKYRQMLVKFGSPNAPGFQVNFRTTLTTIITSTADVPAGVLEIRSAN